MTSARASSSTTTSQAKPPEEPAPAIALTHIAVTELSEDKVVDWPEKVTDADRGVQPGLPVWGETPPPMVRSLPSAHDLSAKTLIPFISHAGYGSGSSEHLIAQHAPKATLRPAFSMQADPKRRTMNLVDAWPGKRATPVSLLPC